MNWDNQTNRTVRVPSLRVGHEWVAEILALRAKDLQTINEMESDNIINDEWDRLVARRYNFLLLVREIQNQMNRMVRQGQKVER